MTAMLSYFLKKRPDSGLAVTKHRNETLIVTTSSKSIYTISKCCNRVSYTRTEPIISWGIKKIKIKEFVSLCICLLAMFGLDRCYSSCRFIQCSFLAIERDNSPEL